MEGFLNPNQVLKQLELKEDMVAADFGSGAGGWAIPLAKRLLSSRRPLRPELEPLSQGKVYAIDILEEPLAVLKSRAKLERVFNIETIRADLEKGTSLASNSVDLVLATNLLFQVEDKKAIFKEVKRVLKKGGQLLIVDWLLRAPLGPEKGRVSSEEVKKMAREFDFQLKKEFKAGIYHYGLIFEV